MFIILLFMLLVSGIVLFVCGYYAAVIRMKLGRNVLLAVPIVLAIFMLNVMMALVELSKSPNWQ
ncbi:hypothetical protein [Robertmurraya massiliosenegalensis]|uniref:hypothetical protein n=1 Tax=Robertmurraya massiliosenegalensis TaxID=1287657 RepID=UPI0002DCB3E8|nr:hypothetical protein [Robertmurraya massiliosenegalensis]